MRAVVPALLAALSLGCTEYGIYDATDRVGKGDAPELATPRQTDTIVQRIPPKVDILWVIDNSGSMAEEQEKVATNFDAFARFIVDSGLEWHMGVVTTDMEDPDHRGQLRGAAGFRYVTPDVPIADQIFKQMVRVGVTGAGEERGIAAAYYALARPNGTLQAANRGFYRDKAALHVIVISDENDQSSGGDEAVSSYEFIDFLRTLKSDPTTPVTFSSIVGPSPTGCRNAATDAGPGTTYLEVTRALPGLGFTICAENWSPVLEALGAQAAGLRTEFFLEELPVPGTIDVWIKDHDGRWQGFDAATTDDLDQACADGGHEQCFLWEYDAARNAIRTLDHIPGPTAVVRIDYARRNEQQPGLFDTAAAE